MTAAAKYMFDTDFSPGASPKIDLAIHKDEIAAAEARGYRSGLTAAEAQTRTEAERRSALAMENIGAAIERLTASLSSIERKLEVEAVEVAAAVARKLAAELVAAEPMTEISALAGGCLSELRSTPHIAIRVHESLHAQTQEKLTQIAAARGFDGRLVVLGVADIAPGDCRIEWADGGVTRDHEAIETAIMEAVSRYIGALQSRE